MKTIVLPIRVLIVLTVLINAAAMLSPIINQGDSVVYAALAQHMVLTGNWADLVLSQADWLDKPHFPFWITALFFKMGGVNAFMYALPGFLFHSLGAYFTYRMARLLYNRDTALLALLLFVTTFNLMYTASDIRAEVYLTGSITGAAYYLLRLDRQFRWKYLVLGALFSAISLMTKGVFTLITICSGMVFLWMYQRRWREFVNGKWYLLIALSFLFTAPELLSLYLQFDAHPEKIMFGRNAVSGIRFFLWDSQFGRFFNFGPIKNVDGTPLYFVHVLLWSFLPWIGVLVAALFRFTWKFKSDAPDDRAATVYLIASFLVTFVLFSATSFQCDYYIVILFPFVIILCARYLQVWLGRAREGRALYAVQVVITLLVVCLVVALAVYVAIGWLGATVLALLCAMAVLVALTRQQRRPYAVFVYPVVAVNVLYIFLELVTWVTMSQYGVAYNAKRFLAAGAGGPVYIYRMDEIIPWELALYSNRPCYAIERKSQLPTSGDYYLLLQDRDATEFGAPTGVAERVAHGDWANHKTGILPRILRLAKGIEPLDPASIWHVHGAPDT